jgi:hypothetical protein
MHDTLLRTLASKTSAEKRPREEYKPLIGKPGKNCVFHTPLTGDARHLLDENLQQSVEEAIVARSGRGSASGWHARKEPCRLNAL